METILIRYGEIALKSPYVRSRFEKKLIKNIRAALKTRMAITEFEIEKERGRIYLHTHRIQDAKEILVKIFGIVSFSPCRVCSSEIGEMVDIATALAEGFISSIDSFAVRTKRTGNHPYSSIEVSIKVAERIIENIGGKINLTSPDKELFLDIRGETAYVYNEIISGHGGLPLGTQGKVMCLLSGGIDSPAATFLIMKRGCSVFPVHFDNRPYTDDRYLDKVKDVFKILKEYSHGEYFNLRVFPYGQVLEWIKENTPEKMTCVFCKRGMMKLGTMMACDLGCDALVSGENLGQVASQTLKNMKTISLASQTPILRPLLTYDKNDIIALARKIGTYDASVAPSIGCLAVPGFPATQSDNEKIIGIEKEKGFEDFLEKIYDNWVANPIIYSSPGESFPPEES